MKRTILILTLVVLVAAMFSSCYESRKSSTCPSHDPNYFRK
ncbi:MAG TPA: hypothetical protein PKM63_16790 [Panacibacter sp.]|nr:hypothetical protein [Panacibacter sp.]HNP45951.1 hypothetical protein [Panacibacter sp.]